MHRDDEQRRAYQRMYYKQARQKEKRAAYKRLYFKDAQRREKRASDAKSYRDGRRLYIFERDKFTCYYCAKRHTREEYFAHRKRLHVDHKIPKDLGGSNDETNLVTACNACNPSKWNRPICEACRSWE